MDFEARVVAQLLRGHTALPEISAQLPAPTSGSSQLPTTPVPGDPKPPSGSDGCLHTCDAPKFMQVHVYTNTLTY